MNRRCSNKINFMDVTKIVNASDLPYKNLAVFHPDKPEKSGWLQKWTNYVKGYRQRWFVIDSIGSLKYYRKMPGSNSSCSCRGTINLKDARIVCDNCSPQITIMTGSQSLHLKAQNEDDKNEWLRALQSAQQKAFTRCRSYKSNPSIEKMREQFDVNLNENFSEILQFAEKIGECVIELKDFSSSFSVADAKKFQFKIDEISDYKEKIIKLSNFIVSSTKAEHSKLTNYTNHESTKCQNLQEQIEILARQHSRLERHTERLIKSPDIDSVKQTVGSLDKNDDEMYYDANDRESFKSICNATDTYSNLDSISIKSESECSSSTTNKNSTNDDTYTTFDASDSSAVFPSSHLQQHPTTEVNNNLSQEMSENQRQQKLISSHAFQRRTLIPTRPTCSLNLWSFVRDCIGKELTRIPMPVNFNEPLSFLQRLTEDLEYSFLLDQAAEKEDSCEQLAYVVAYAVSAYSTTSNRTTKPFNPLLGETFEFDRTDDLGWRCIAEQVSHHPPIAARHVEGKSWLTYLDTQITSRFRGKYLSVVPMGTIHVHFKSSGNHYTFTKVTTTVHNIIVGKLWIDNHGEMIVQNHTNGDKGIVKFNAYNYFSTEKPRKVHGIVQNKEGEVKWIIQGSWDKFLNLSKNFQQKNTSGDESISSRQIWATNSPYPGSEKMYHFTKFAIELNEEDESVAPTDSRRRPDQRLMERGNWDEANRQKNQLEEKQRRSRKIFESQSEQAEKEGSALEYRPKWFEKASDPYTGTLIYTLIDSEYWKCKDKRDWSRCPDIF